MTTDFEYKTYGDLFKALLQFTLKDFKKWISTKTYGKEKLEICLRLFGSLHLIPALNKYKYCVGNFNKGTITDIFNRREFLESGTSRKGDSADAVFSDSNNIVVFTCKNYEADVHVGQLDIPNIQLHYSECKYTKKLILGICCRDKQSLLHTVSRAEKSSQKIVDIIRGSTTIILDISDITNTFVMFKENYTENFLKEIQDARIPLTPYFHQTLLSKKIIQQLETNKAVVCGAISRSGKTYIMGLLAKKVNTSLIITLKPTETFQSLLEFFKSYNFGEYNIIPLDGKCGKPKLSQKNIIICSKQFLQGKINRSSSSEEDDQKITHIPWLKSLNIDLALIDEPHDGGSTSLAKQIYETYVKNVNTVYFTSTYNKPVGVFKITENNIVKWGMVEIERCKNIDELSKKQLQDQYGEALVNSVLDQYPDLIIKDTYRRYPRLVFNNIHFEPNLKSIILDKELGWSLKALFMLTKNGDFKDREQVKNFLISIFGRDIDYGGVVDPDRNSVFSQIRKFSTEEKTRTFCNKEPIIIVAFLDSSNISKTGNALKTLIQEEKLLPNFNIICTNGVDNGSKTAIDIINSELVQVENQKKQGLLVLTGKMITTGVTLKKCDIVLLLNGVHSYDLVYQMMFRCMTEDDGKKFGFVYDFNNQRYIRFIYNIACESYPEERDKKKAIKYVLDQKMIQLQGDNWFNKHFKTTRPTSEAIAEYLYNSYLKDVCITEKFIQELKLYVNISEKYKTLFNKLFKVSKTSKNSKEELKEKEDLINDHLGGKDRDVSDGVEEVESKEISERKTSDNSETIDLFRDIFPYIVVYACLFTLKNDISNFSDMCTEIIGDEVFKNIAINQLRNCWGKTIPENIFSLFIDVYKESMSDNRELIDNVAYIKTRFRAVSDDRKQLYNLIEKYLVPNEAEKKGHAEVSTPPTLRTNMLSHIPKFIWKKKIRVFEPCCGKGGFLIDIVDMFMTGLKDVISERDKRYKFIVEKMLYFADINPMNIYICKLLLDPNDQYKLNYYEGDTLQLDIQKQWDIRGFTSVIGNPPYNSSGNTGTGNTIWQNFTRKAIENWLLPNGYLCFVHPPGWRKPNTERGKFYGLYDLMTNQNQMLYLSIHGVKDGLKTFKCGTRYDWYVIQKKKPFKITVVNDEQNLNIQVEMSGLTWLPNSNIDTIHKILGSEGDEKCPIIYDRTAYGADKKDRISPIETEEFKYPCIHSTPKNGVRYMYSKVNDRGHFGVSKVIFGDSGIHKPVIDMEGKYGMTQHSMAIQVDSLEEATNICKAIETGKFLKIIQSCLYSSYAIDWNIFKEFRKDFWREFV